MKINYFYSTEEILTELGRRIKEARIAMTITQKEMSERTNLSQRTISNLENGKDVSFTTVIEVLRVLGKLPSLDIMISEQTLRPSDIAALGKTRERVRKKENNNTVDTGSWKWRDDK